MINYETILSLFDDKLTLLEYLTKIEQALKNEQLTDITVTQTDASHVYFTFIFEDGSTIDTPTFTLPKGDTGATGATGADGVSVVDADIDASGHLILTLSNGNTIDAGATGLQKVTASDVDSETATQYEVLKANGSGGATWGRVTDGDIADNNQVGQYLGSTGYGFAGWKKFEIPGVLVTSGGATAGQVLTSDGSDKASWEPIPAQTPEGTAIKSTGETSGKVLTANGNGGASWQNAGGGSGKYMHNITLRSSDSSIVNFLTFSFVNSSSTAYTTISALASAIYNITNNNLDCINATGIFENNGEKQIIVGIYAYSTSILNGRYMNLQTPGTVTYGSISSVFSYINDRVDTL